MCKLLGFEQTTTRKHCIGWFAVTLADTISNVLNSDLDKGEGLSCKLCLDKRRVLSYKQCLDRGRVLSHEQLSHR